MTTTASAPPDTKSEPPARWYARSRVGQWIESARVQNVIIVIIVINAAALGFETSDTIMARHGELLHVIDHVCLGIFVAELAIKLYAFRLKFFTTSWNVFDLLVVAIALIPGSGAFGVLRSLRVLRVLRLISMVPQLRRVVEALVRAIPGILSIGALLALLFYVSGVMATMLFKDSHPEEFGSLSSSLFSLFQVMTLDNWSVITRDIITVHPWAPAFFVPYVLLSAFTVLNLFIAVIVDAMQHLRTEDVPDPTSAAQDDAGTAAADPTDADVAVHAELAALRHQVAELTQLIRAREG